MKIRTAVATALLFAAGAHAQVYPVKPVRLVIPFAPGGGSDLVGRMLAQKLSVALGQQFLPENRAGAGGRIGTELVARAAPDGYTLLMATSSVMATAPALYAKLGFNMPRDFAMITMVGQTAHALVLHPSVPARSVKELIAVARRQPGNITYASSGAGGPGHLSGELFDAMAGVKTTHVAYKGSGPATLSVVGGETHLMFSNIVPALPPIRNGRLRAIGVGSITRSILLPDVPTVSESGLPGFDVRQFYAVLAPAGLPRDLVARLNDAIIKAMQAPDTKERLLTDGTEVLTSTPEELEKIILVEIAKWTKVIKQAGITGE